MRNRRSPWIFILLLLTGALIGGFVGEFLSRYQYFTWMSFGGTGGYRNLLAFSLQPAFDFRIIRLGFDFALRINAGSILGMVISMFVFFRA